MYGYGIFFSFFSIRLEGVEMILDSISHVHKSQPALTDSFSHTLVFATRFVIIDTALLLSAKGAHYILCFFGFIPRDVFFGRPLPRREQLCWTLFRTTLALDGSSSSLFFLVVVCMRCKYSVAQLRRYFQLLSLSLLCAARSLFLFLCVSLLPFLSSRFAWFGPHIRWREETKNTYRRQPALEW